MRQLVLASSSVYRRELLERLKVPFTTFSPDIDESHQHGEPHQDHVLRLSEEKARKGASLFPEAVLIGSDEVASLDGAILGKPLTHDNAKAQLRQMSGKEVHFYTGVSVHVPFLKHTDTRLSTTTVKFRKLSETMIENYLSKERPYHSAGSFKSETLGSALLERFESDDPTAIIGLPLIVLCDMLAKAGFDVI
jgi:septum formation protein